MSELYIPNSVALGNFDSLFKANNYDFSDGKVNITFHSKYVALHPVGLAFYAGLGDYFRQNNIETTASINHSIKSIPYLQRMGLFRALGYEDPVGIKSHEETGRFISLRKIRNSEELDAFIKTVDPLLHTTEESSRVIKHVFSEILRNVLEHSESAFGGNVCANYNKNSNRFSIGISDAGRGIFESMRQFHEVKTHEDALVCALTPGISGKTSRVGGTPENAGAGLFFTKCIAKSTRNHFLIYSGDTYFKLKLTPPQQTVHYYTNPLDDKSTIKEKLPEYRGTLIGIDINLSDSAAFVKLMDRIGNAYQLGIRKTKRDLSKKINFT